MVKYGVYDGEDLKVKMDAIGQELRQWVQLYYDGFECLFIRGRILDVKRKRRFLTHFKPKIKKLCVVHAYVDMEKLLAIATKVEKVLGEMGEIAFKPLKNERDEEANEGGNSTK